MCIYAFIRIYIEIVRHCTEQLWTYAVRRWTTGTDVADGSRQLGWLQQHTPPPLPGAVPPRQTFLCTQLQQLAEQFEPIVRSGLFAVRSSFAIFVRNVGWFCDCRGVLWLNGAVRSCRVSLRWNCKMANRRAMLSSMEPLPNSQGDPLRELFEACKTGDIARVRKLITPQTVNARDTAGRKSTPLHFAAGTSWT